MQDNDDFKTDEDVESPEIKGESSISGSTPATTSDDDVEEAVEEVIGNKPVPGKPFSIADEVRKDQKALHDIPPDEADLEGAEEDKDPFSDK